MFGGECGGGLAGFLVRLGYFGASFLWLWLVGGDDAEACGYRPWERERVSVIFLVLGSFQVVLLVQW